MWAVVAGALCLAARPAAAQEEPEALIKQGVEMRKRGDDLKAHGYFQRAYDLARTPRSAAQLGLCDLAVEDHLAADQHLTEALASNDPWVAKNRALLEHGRETARSHLGRVVVSHAPADTTVEVAGRPATPLPADGTIWVPPAGTDLRFAAPGHEPFKARVSVAAGASDTLEAQLPEVAGASPVAPREKEEPGHETPPLVTPSGEAPAQPAGRPWQTTAAWIVGGVGVAFLAAGVTAHVLYAGKIDDFNSNARCNKASPNDGGADCAQLLSDANARLTFAVVGYSVAGAALVGSLVLALTAPSSGGGADRVAAGCWPNQREGLSCALSLRF